jgi:hypothetical protein
MAMKFHKCSEFDQMDFDDLDDCGTYLTSRDFLCQVPEFL